MGNSFYALMSRMKLIERWSLMRSTKKESLMEHSAEVAILGQALAVIKNEYYGGNVDIGSVASIALYHDINEVLSGDLPTPIKYFNEKITTAYHEIEDAITDKMLESLPIKMQNDYCQFLRPDPNSIEYKIVKAADKLSAYVKCVEEAASGNHEFDVAIKSIKKSLIELKMDEVNYFLDNFLAGFGKPLDTL